MFVPITTEITKTTKITTKTTKITLIEQVAIALVVVFGVFQIPCSGSLPLFILLSLLQGADCHNGMYYTM